MLVFGESDDLHRAGELIRRGAAPAELDPASVLELAQRAAGALRP